MLHYPSLNVIQMTRRIVSILLVPLLLVSQGFWAAHSHAGTSVAEPEGHSARAHVHLHGGEHHHHHSHHEHDGDDSDDRPPASPVEPGPLDHDSDAVYLSETQLYTDAKPTKVAKADWSVLCMIADDSTSIAEAQFTAGLRSPPPPIHLKCPIYLTTLSIRC